MDGVTEQVLANGFLTEGMSWEHKDEGRGICPLCHREKDESGCRVSVDVEYERKAFHRSDPPTVQAKVWIFCDGFGDTFLARDAVLRFQHIRTNGEGAQTDA